MDLVSWTFGNTSYDQDRPIFIDASNTSQHISASEARTLVRQLIAGLRAAGLKRGDTVCMLALSSIYYPIFFLAISGAGGRVAGGNPGHTVYELQHLLSKCSVEFIITEPSLLEKATAASQKCGINPSNIFIYEGQAGGVSTSSQSWRRLLCHGECDWDVLDADQAAKTVAAYYSTSGTTGAPKFAAVSHSYQIVSGGYIEMETKSKPYEVSRLVSLPLMHAFAAPLVHTAALRCGTPTFIMARFSAANFMSTISEHRLTEFAAVPSMLITIINSMHHTTAALETVREVICAGAPLSTVLAESFSAALTAPSARLVQLYGATEAGWMCSTPFTCETSSKRNSGSWVSLPSQSASSSPTSSPPSPLSGAFIAAATAAAAESASLTVRPTPSPTVGVPLPGYSIRLIDSTSGMTISSINQPGSVEVRAPHPFLHYVGADQATRDSFTEDGWLKTGDVAIRDGQGRYYIVDREKDMIKVRGWQVAPAEIESVLASHPDVEDCAVLGVLDTKGASGEVPFAFVALRRGHIITGGGSNGDTGMLKSHSQAQQFLPNEKMLKTWLRERIAGYKVPEEIMIIPSIPRNPAGKILRRLLREQFMSNDRIMVPPTPPISVSRPAIKTLTTMPPKVEAIYVNALSSATLSPIDSAARTVVSTPAPVTEKQLAELLRLSSKGELKTQSVDADGTTANDKENTTGGVGNVGLSALYHDRWLFNAGNNNSSRRRGGAVFGLAATLCMLLSNRPRLAVYLPLGLGLGALVFRSGLMTELRVWLMTR